MYNQIKPDLIIMWPSHLEYPGFRLQLIRDRDYFNNIIIGLNNCNFNAQQAQLLSAHLQKEMGNDPKIFFVSSDEIASYPSSDWVTSCICPCLDRVESEWILLIQQDFVIHNLSMLTTVLTDQYNIIGRREAGIADGNPVNCLCQGQGSIMDARWEPDFLLIRTDIVKNSSKNFSVGLHPDRGTGMDTFGPWSIEINKKHTNSTTLHNLGFHMPTDYEHFRGFTEGYCMLDRGMIDRIILKERFSQYHKDILKEIDQINVHPITLDLVRKAAALI